MQHTFYIMVGLFDYPRYPDSPDSLHSHIALACKRCCSLGTINLVDF
jgi:hypothetical protein